MKKKLRQAMAVSFVTLGIAGLAAGAGVLAAMQNNADGGQNAAGESAFAAQAAARKLKISVRTKNLRKFLLPARVFMPLNIAKSPELRYIYMQFVKMGIIVSILLLHS